MKTAEGALQEVQTICRPMDDLATQSANGPHHAVDRDNLQKEVDSLKKEITASPIPPTSTARNSSTASLQ